MSLAELLLFKISTDKV